MNFDKKNLDEDEYEKKLEEERRIFYVGMTRAKDELNIVVPGEPSQLIEELLMANRIRT